MEFLAAHYQIKAGEHENKPVLWLHFPYDIVKTAALKERGGRWSQSQKCWYLKDTAHNRTLTDQPQKAIGKEALSRISAVNRPALKMLEETLRLKAYSPSTLRTYLTEFAQLLYLLKNTPIDSLPAERLRSYILYCIQELKLSENTIHSRLNAIKFYFEQVLHRERFFAEIPRPKKPSLLPKVFSLQDVGKIFASVENTKHRLMLQLCYGMGLRVSEVVALKLAHIDSNRMQVLLAGAKGKKDRYTPLPQTALGQLRQYYTAYKPKDFLFEGAAGGQYSIRSVQAVFKSALKRAGINKPIGIHGLRHSYATHLHEYGTDITLIQKLLGHNNLKTTMLYTHVSQQSLTAVVSPLDRMGT